MPEGQVLTKPNNYFSRYNLHRLVILANRGKLARQLYSLIWRQNRRDNSNICIAIYSSLL